MSRRTFILLIVIIAVMAVLLMSNRQDFADREAALLLPGLENELNDITSLTIKAAGDRTIATLTRGAERWTVAERGGYPADIGKIRDNLISLANATIVEEKTADPTRYARLGVEAITDENATGVELMIVGHNEPYRIIIGKTGVRGDQAYARKPDDAVSLLIAAALNLGTEATDWLKRDIIDIPASNIYRVTTTHPDGEQVSIEKAEPQAGGFELTNLADDAELAYPGVTDSIGAALAGLSLDDVLLQTDVSIQDLQSVETRFETFDGLVIIANIYTSDEQSFVRFAFSADAELTARFATADPDEAAPDTGSAAAMAAELNARHQDWLYVLPDSKHNELTRRMSDLVN